MYIKFQKLPEHLKYNFKTLNMVITQLDTEQLSDLVQNALRKVISESVKEPSSSNTDELLTIRQTSELLSIAVPTIYGLVQRSKIPVSKKGKRLYFSKLELIAWIKTGKKLTISEIESQAHNYLKNGKKGGDK